MKRILILGAMLAIGAALLFPAPVQSQNMPQVLQGTQIRLILLNGLSTSVAREGDPFAAQVAEPVYLGEQLLLPAGTRVNGEVGPIVRPKRFSLFRGQAAMALYIKSIQMDNREIPAPMSIISIHETFTESDAKQRKDLKTEEGAIVSAKRDVKGDMKVMGLSTAAGGAVGAIFSHAVRGLWFGLAGSGAYVVAKKGKEIELPARTGFLVRTDSTVTLPTMVQPAAAHTGSN